MKNRMMKVAALLLVLTLMTSCFVGGTFAKYTSENDGSATATVAKWGFEVGGKELAKEEFTFNLFDTINDSDGTTDEGDVADQKIAPGTSGSFQLALKNTSEVTAACKVTLAHVNTSSIPLEYSADGTNWYSDISQVVAETGNIAIGGSYNVTIYWRWQYGDVSGLKDDTTDTTLGLLDNVTVTVTATVTAWQVD